MVLLWLLLALLVQCIATDDEPQEWWIGYTEGRNDLPEGQFANWSTQRAYVVRADGQQRRELGSELRNGPHRWTQMAGWSPDGKSGIVQSLWEDPANAQWEREHRTFRMTEGWLADACLVDIDSGAINNVTGIDRVSIYNSGLFFLPNNRGYGFTALIQGISKPFQMDLDGRNKRDVSGGGGGFSYGYSVSPDGKLITYHEDYQIYIANADGSEKRKIETGNPFNFVPQWSPDGNLLMFLSGEHYNCHPTIVQRDGKGLRKLADRGGYRGVVERLKHPDFHSESSDVPVWGRDSKQVFYTAKVQHGTGIQSAEPNSVELHCVDLKGNVSQLTHSTPGTRHYHPAVSPNGKWILFGSDRSGTMQLYVGTLDGKSSWAITEVPEGSCAMHGYWAPKPIRSR